MEKDLLQIIHQVLGAESFSKPALDLLGDDSATIKLAKDSNLVLCADVINEGVHFDTSYYSAFDIGWKALAINLSDIAAMAATPKYILVTLSLNEKIGDKKLWVKEFYEGLNQCAKEFYQPIVIGGDLSRAQQTSVSLTAIGFCESEALKRSNAKAGDKIFVTGEFGNAAYFLEKISNTSLEDLRLTSAKAVEAALRIKPRIKEALALQKISPDAALCDASDGLAAALLEIAERSDCQLEFDPNLVPRDAAVSLEQALFGGEDFELVATATEAPAEWICIGEVKAGAAAVINKQSGEKLESSSAYQHF